jgi:hypothetical protein
MAEQDPSRGTVNDTSTVVLDADTLADVQRGKIKRPEFYGDMSMSAMGFGNFQQAVSTAGTYFNFAKNIADSLTDARSADDRVFRLTRDEYTQIEKKAASISRFGSVPYETILTFITILCLVDNKVDMEKISSVLEIEELNESVIRKPYLIIEIRDLYKIVYMASALDSLIKLFNRYLTASQATAQNINSDDISDLFSNIGSLLGGLSGGGASSKLANMTGSEDALGHFMSELLEGKRIPMPVIAKNPMKQSPSYTGQALFGESPTPLSLMDITEVFNKKIAVFPKPSNGAGMSSFGMQNFSSLSGSMNLSTMISKLNFGGSTPTPGSYIDKQITAIGEKIKLMTGVKDTETFELNRADVAIPMQIAMSASNCGLDKTPFATKSFQNGWQLSNHINNFMQNNNPDFFKIIKGLS